MEELYVIEYWNESKQRKIKVIPEAPLAYEFYKAQTKARILEIQYENTIQASIKAHKGIQGLLTTRIYGFMIKLTGYTEAQEKYTYTYINFYPEIWQLEEDQKKYKNKKYYQYQILLHNRGGQCFFIKSN